MAYHGMGPPRGRRRHRPPQTVGAPPVGQTDVFATIEKLAELRDKGILSEQEFATKKAELLARL